MQGFLPTWVGKCKEWDALAEEHLEKLTEERAKGRVEEAFKQQYHSPVGAKSGETQKRAREALMQRKEQAQKRRMVAMPKASSAKWRCPCARWSPDT